MVTYICDDDEFTDTLLPENETYLHVHGYCSQVELTQITVIYIIKEEMVNAPFAVISRAPERVNVLILSITLFMY